RLRILRFCEFGFRAGETTLSQVITKGDVGLVEPLFRSGKFLGQIASHPDALRALSCEQKCGFAHRSLHPGPRTTRPALAPVCLPAASTWTPLTKTWIMPVEYWCGCSKVAWSSIVAGSNTTTSAK